MIKAVSFDWFNTLVNFAPPRETLYAQAFSQFGIELPPKSVIRGILAGDRHFFEENAKSPVAKRSLREQAEVYGYYPEAILADAGIEPLPELPLKVQMIVKELFEGSTLVLFDDVLSTLESLKRRKLLLGLVTNARMDTLSIYRKLGLEPYLDFVVTSEEVGVDKPDPRIFLAALKRAGVKAEEALHVGDQYEIDVVGARRVDVAPVLIDRQDTFPEINDCPRISNLGQVANYL